MSRSHSDNQAAEDEVASGRAWAEFCDTVRDASQFIAADSAALDSLDRSEGYRYLSRLVRAGLEGCLEYADPRAPELLRLCHETIKMGADNPDNVYLSAPVHPDFEYRMSAQREADLELDAERLLADAVEQSAGLSDFGEGYRENLDALLGMYRTTARLSAAGRKSTRRRLLSLLKNRLQIAHAFEHAPEIRARKLARPLYIVGLPRTGTSALFNLLARDAASRPLLYWEGLHPEPGPPLAPAEIDPRLLSTRRDLERAYARNPEFRALHHVRADGPEECVALLSHTLGSVQMGVEPMISPYREHFERQDQRANYRYYTGLLRLLDSQRPGRRWLLKSPAHLWALAALVEQFPDACIVWTHRDPTAVVGSYCSMIEALSTLREDVDPRELGAAVLAHLAASVERAMQERSTLDPRRFVDVAHSEALHAPLDVVERMYDHFGLDACAEDLERMRAYDTARPEPAAGEHRYDLGRYGLHAEQVSERFRDYARKYSEFLPTP